MPKDPTGVKSRRAQRKPPAPKEAPSKAVDSFAGRRLQVEWDNPRTNRLLDWLDQNPDDHDRLFSNSTAAAKEENRRKVTAKGTKNYYYLALAKAVFDCEEEDVEMCAWYRKEPAKFSASLTNYLNRQVFAMF